MSTKKIKTSAYPSTVSTLEFGDREFSSELHIHREMQILAGKSGMLEVKIASKKVNLRVGDVLLIKNAVSHSAKPILPFTTTMSIRIMPNALAPEFALNSDSSLYDALSNFDKDFIYLRREDETTAEIFSTLTRICEENEKKEQSYTLFIEGYLKILLAILERKGVLKSSAATLDTKAVSKISPALLYVDKNYTKEISLEEIAKTLDMNREYFCRLFKKTVGITFVDYVNLVRIIRAKELLISPQKSIQEISDELGFSSVSYFTRVFKNITYKTPATYRNIKLF